MPGQNGRCGRSALPSAQVALEPSSHRGGGGIVGKPLAQRGGPVKSGHRGRDRRMALPSVHVALLPSAQRGGSRSSAWA